MSNSEPWEKVDQPPKGFVTHRLKNTALSKHKEMLETTCAYSAKANVLFPLAFLKTNTILEIGI